MKVLLDTSFMVAVVENRIDLDAELRKFGPPELFVLDLVVKELESLCRGRGKDAENAKLAILLLGRKMVNIINAGGGNTDKRLMETAKSRGMSVCTIDRKLRDSLMKKGIEVINIRQGKYLERAK